LSPAVLPADSNAGCITDVRTRAAVFELDEPVDAALDDEKVINSINCRSASGEVMLLCFAANVIVTFRLPENPSLIAK